MNKLLKRFCPFCKELVVIIGKEKTKSIGSCSHAFSFKKTKSEKIMDRKYVQTPWGLELASNLKENGKD